MMKILQLNSVYAYGSTGRIVKDLKDIIQKNNQLGGVIYGRGLPSTEENVWKIGSELDFKLHVIYTRLTDKTGFWSTKNTEHIIQKIKEFNPDIIHLHNIHGYYVNIEILFKFLKAYNKPVVWTLHDCWSFTGHCAYYDAANCQKWQIECQQCPQIHEYPKSFVDNTIYNFNKKKELFTSLEKLYLVTPSKWLKQEVQKSFLKAYPCYVIANGIDLNKFKAKENLDKKVVLNSKIKVLGVASVWEKRKGIDDFIKLAQAINLDEYEITMVGVNAQQKQILETYGIVAIERTNSIEELVQLYSQADIFFNPTYDEVLGMTNIEALACGTPVLTYQTGGSPESLTEECGIVVEKGDLKSVIEHLTHLKINNLSSISCVEQSKKYDKNILFTEYVKLYQNIIVSSGQ